MGAPTKTLAPAAISQFCIGEFRFKNKATAELSIRATLERYHNRESLHGDDLALAHALLDLHPNREVIRDCGIKDIWVQHLPGEQRRFAVTRTDGSIRDFTWRHALHPKSHRQKVLRLCRNHIADQIEEFRDAFFAAEGPNLCPITDRPITPACSDVDHETPHTFVALVDAWLALNRITYEDVDAIASPHWQQPDRFADEVLQENWVEFHRDRAVLRIVHRDANRSILRRRK